MAVTEDRRRIAVRLMVLQVGVVLTFAALAISFWFLQIIQHTRYQEMAENNHQRTLALRAPRGVLFDRNGKVLVENRHSFTVSIVREHTKDLDRTIRLLAAVAGLDVAQVRQIVDRHRHLSRNLLDKPKFSWLVRFLMNAAQRDSSKSSMRGAQGQTATGRNVIRSEPLHGSRKTDFVLHVIESERLLRLPDEARERIFDGQFANQIPGRRFLQNMYPHYVSLGIVEPYAQVVKLENVSEGPREIVEQLRQIPMRNDRLGDP